jgi:hypothetical protein
VSDSATLANTIRCLELLEQSHTAYAAGDTTRCHELVAQASEEFGSDILVLIRGGMTIGEIPQPGDDHWCEYLDHQRGRLAQLIAQEARP